MSNPKQPSDDEEEEFKPISIKEEISLSDEKTAEAKEEESEENTLFPTDPELRPPPQQYNL